MKSVQIDIEIKVAQQQGQHNWFRASVCNIDLFKGFENELTPSQRDLLSAAIDAQGDAMKSFASRIKK